MLASLLASLSSPTCGFGSVTQRRTGLFGAFATVSALAISPPAGAEQRPTPANVVPACVERQASALGQVACELASALPKADPSEPILVVAEPIQSAVRAERLDQLAARLSALVAGELGPSARALEGAVSGGAVARYARPGLRVVRLTATLTGEQLRASADVVARPARFWERLGGVAPGVAAHAFAARPLDAELRSFLPPVPLVVTRIDKAAPLAEAGLALACGDANADGSLEIAYVGRHRVQLGRIERGRFVTLAARPWSELSDVAPAPLREPIASAEVLEPGVLHVGLSDRAAAVQLDARLQVVRRFPGRLPWPANGCARLGVTALEATPVRCDVATTPSERGAGTADALAGVRLVRRDGSALPVIARRRQADARIELEIGARRIELPDPSGAQLAVGDLDGDGSPELVSTADTLDPAGDFIRIRSFADNGEIREIVRVPVPAGVQALGLCPGDGKALAPIVAATREGVWVLR